MTNSGFIYLASPLSHEDQEIMHKRYEAAARETARCFHLGMTVFSPVVYSYHLASKHNLPQGWHFWRPFDLAMIDLCQYVAVLTLPGWDKSIGVKDEIAYANMIGKIVTYWSEQ